MSVCTMSSWRRHSTTSMRRALTTAIRRPPLSQLRHFADMPAMQQAREDPDFHYTSGRWIYNESKRLKERHLEFDKSALARAAANSVGRHEDDVQSLCKMAEYGFNRFFELTMRDGLQMIARLPYSFNLPKSLMTASEVATMDLLRCYGVPTPIVYEYHANTENAVGAEYILMEKSFGRSLGDVWFTLPENDRVKVLDQMVNLEAKMFDIPFPAYGSVYYREDLRQRLGSVQFKGPSSRFCIGPDVSLEHWYETRSELDFERGAITSPLEALQNGAKREAALLRSCGKPRFPFDRSLRDLCDYQKSDPTEHLASLERFLDAAPKLMPSEKWLHKPMIRQPDLNLNNVFIDDCCNVVSIVDWQHASVLPLFLAAGIPRYFQNCDDYYKDSDSVEWKKPEPKPELDADGILEETEMYQGRQVHYHYMQATAAKLSPHFKAMQHKGLQTLRSVYGRAKWLWDGNSIPLKAALAQLVRKWPEIQKSGQTADEEVSHCPVTLDEHEAADAIEKLSRQKGRKFTMAVLQAKFGIASDGWVPHEGYDRAVSLAAEDKEEDLEDAKDDFEREMIHRHWPIDDHDEDD